MMINLVAPAFHPPSRIVMERSQMGSPHGRYFSGPVFHG
jgi:hypothetical protein